MTNGRIAVLMTAALAVAACASPTSTPAPPPSVEPTGPSGELAQFSNRFGLSFDYPIEWPVISGGDDMVGADLTVVVLGTGAWNTGCVHEPHSVTCTGQQFVANPGEFVASIVTRGHGPAALTYEVPAIDGAALNESGLAVQTDEGLGRAIQATIFVPGHSPFYASFRFGSEPTDAERAEVASLLESLALTGEVRSTSIANWDFLGAGECALETVVGQLTRGDANGLNLGGSGGAALSWPPGWRAQLGDHGRVEIVDKGDEVVAREWDMVSLGGRGDPNEFRICPDAIEVVQEFPSGD